jgi:hypothetical protein
LKTALCLLVFFLNSHVALAQEEVVVPEGVRYIKASAETNRLAEQKLRKFFSNQTTNEDILNLLNSNPLFCGPFLWEKLRKNKNVSVITTGNVNLEIPVFNENNERIDTEKKEGKVFQSAEEALAFWKAFTATVDLKNYKIRKLNPYELQVYWAMIPFDITEPIFIVESKEYKFLTAFMSPDNLKIIWIDDYHNPL